MQSGITASKELQDAFRAFLNDPSSRGLLASISKSPESLIPTKTIPSSSANFSSDLVNLQPLLEDNVAAYIILREEKRSEVSGASGSLVAVTYVPDPAPVRQKMLFASTRLTLVRELGTEHFVSTLFATTKAELTAEGWAKHEAHGSLAAPLTQEEQDLVILREAEAQESTGTAGKRGGHLSGAMDIRIDNDVELALTKFKDGHFGLVELHIDIPTETLKLSSTHPNPTPASALQSIISPKSPRYTFYQYPSTSQLLFLYTCPTTATIKERMLYASMRRAASLTVPQRVGITVAKSIETGGVEDLTESLIAEELGQDKGGEGETPTNGATTSSQRLGSSSGFARPKRPGARR